MITPLLYLLYGGVAFGLLCLYRSMWVAYKLEDYHFRATHYLTMNQLPAEVAHSMYETWGKEWMYWELWRWDFSRYIVDQEHYHGMLEYMDTQLARTDLDYETFRREVAALPDPNVVAPVPAAEPPAPRLGGGA